MGYAEFGGGGSVLWHVRHGQGGGNHGRDPKPDPGSGFFTIYVDGARIGQWPINFANPRQIQILWDPQTENERQSLAATVQEERALIAASDRPGASGY